ncbi:MAG: protein kinase [Gemmatimonadota bacterium]|nr:protein kinase [Gemmatimonadota bacterium]
MTSDWTRIDDVLRGALDLDPSARDAYIRAASGGDEDFEAVIRRLLDRAERSGGFLEPEAGMVGAFAEQMGDADPTDDANDVGPLEPGDTVGSFRIVEQIGAGGMGSVYLAERADGQFEQRVAIKVVRHPTAAGPTVQRFLRERQILARLEHPNIARLHDGGLTDHGFPYVVMEYVDGMPLTDHCVSGALDLDGRLELFEHVCAAVAYAHRHGVVHRDLKPSNILVNDEGRVLLLDFGIAKLLGDDSRGEALTRTGMHVLTPAYASPEQWSGGEVTEASDVYQLGVLLYELIAGRRPASGETTHPGVVAGAARPSDLDRVCAKARADQPAERYRDAAELGGDVARYRAGLPVHARPATAGYRMSRFLRRHRGAAALAAGLVAISLAGGYVARGFGGGAPPVTDRSIAVLPFEATGGEEGIRFGEGLHDGLLTRLTNVAALTVKSRTSTERYGGGTASIPQIAAELGVGWIVEGGIRQAADRIRVSATLIDARSDSRRWAQDYDIEITLDNVFDVQSDLARRIVESLEAELSPAEQERIARHPTEDLEAYRLYVDGRIHMDRRTETGIRRAADLFEQAIARDSMYALAWSGLADAGHLLASFGFAPADSVRNPALGAARRAVELDPGLAEAHVSLAMLQNDYLRDGAGAIRALERAIELKPSYAQAHQWLGSLEGGRGREREALAHLRRAAELDPRSPVIQLVLGWTHWWVEGPDSTALAHVRASSDLEPSFPMAHVDEGLILADAGRLDEARDALQRGLDLAVDGSFAAGLGLAGMGVTHAYAGDAVRAREVLAALAEDGDTPMWEALVLSALGDVDAAFEALERVEWDFVMKWDLLVFPFFDALREDPRYDELVRENNVRWGLNPDGSLPHR